EIVAEMDVFGYPLCEDTYASTDLVLQEVMYAGIPAVVFPYGGLLQTVKDGHNGIVVNNAEQYKEAIEFLYGNPAERDRLGKNAKAYVERHLGIENTVNQYHGIYSKLLEQPKVHHAWGKDHDRPLLQQPMAYQDITGAWPQESASQLFIDSLGQYAGAFEQSMHWEGLATCFEADTELSQSSDLLFLDGILKYREFDPHDPYLNYWAGLVFKDRQSPNQAITCWMNAHRQGFSHWRLYLYLANALQAVGKKVDARKIWEYLLKIRPDFEKEMEAIAPQRLAVERPPQAPLTHAGDCQRPDNARGDANGHLGTRPPEEMYQALQPLITEGKQEELVRGLEALLELYPSFALAHNDLGVLCLNRGEKETALRHYEKAVGLEPENMVFQKNLADLYSFGLGRVEEAIQIYKKILASHPEDVETLVAMGHICKAGNHLKDALFFYEKAMEVSEEMRNSREAVLNLGSICASLEEPEKAREVYLSFLSKNMEDKAVILAWESLKDKDEDKEIEELVTAQERDYLVSAIVSTYNSEEFMAQCLENLEAQTISQQIEVLVIDAASPQNERRIVKDFQKRYSNITYVRTKGRIGIYTAWNLAAQMASGTYCMTVSTNDHLRKDACEVLARALDANPDAMLVYGDTYLTETPHETFDRNTHYGAYCWPPYCFEALLHNCMVGPHPMWRTSVHEEIGHFDDRYVTVADQEFWLRIGERHNLLHIPEFTGLQWITCDAISRKGALPSLEIAHIHGRYQKRHTSQPHATKKCSIIIPAFNQLAYTKQCLEALFKNTPEEMYELIVVDNGSTDGTKAFLTTLGQRATIITNGKNLGFARACNQGARAASGKYLIFLNNDTLPLPCWLEEMVELAERDETVGIVGSKLLFPDGTIQHAGVVVSGNGLPYHLHRGCPGDMPCANKQRSFQIVTAACMLISRDLFFDIKGFDEGYVNGCEDIDLCLKVGESKRRVVYNPKSVLVHFEGKTEGR
ncbi:MAG: glycosyltransferase, partial [Thermodesulfobacteriota bacterium]|nr:glycosyltransferase [Thermodesulfobacteriota bacterium]